MPTTSRKKREYQPDGTRDKLDKKRYDQHTKDLPNLRIGQHIRVLNKEAIIWTTAAVTQACTEPRSYIVQTLSGQIFRRNGQHLREDSSKIKTRHKVYPFEIPQRSTQGWRPTHHQNYPSQHTPHETHDSNLLSGTATHIRTRSGRIIRPPTKFNE